MIRSFLILALFTYFATLPRAQGCLSQGITFSTQGAIDSFTYYYPGCSIIEGDVYIAGNTISNFDSLCHVVKIAGDLTIEFCGILQDLHGFSALEHIYGNLFIKSNAFLKHLWGQMCIRDRIISGSVHWRW